MARPTKLNPEARECILDALRDGNRRVIAARLAGVGESTFHSWMADERPPGTTIRHRRGAAMDDRGASQEALPKFHLMSPFAAICSEAQPPVFGR